MKKDPIRIILVDDHELVRQSWKMLLESNSRFKVVADCKNGETAIEQTKILSPDIIMVDINMSPDNGFTVTQQILKLMPSAKVIGLSANNQPKYATRMISLGAKGYLTKTSPLDELIHGILQVYEGHTYICKEIQKHMPGAE